MSTTALVVRPRHKQHGVFSKKIEEAKQYIWNADTNQILHRNTRDCGKLVLFYVVFYVCLAIFFGIMMALMRYVVIDANRPTRQGMDSLMKGNPGLSYRPLPDYRSNLIRFIQGIQSSYKVHTDHIQAFIDQYENDKQVGENFIDCTKGKTEEQREKVCRFNVDDLGAECTWQKDYGFDEGQPCILLKFNQVYGWMADNYPPGQVPAQIASVWNQDYITVTCEGENPPDLENIGNITFYPSNGFPFYYFPYENQEGFRAPIVFARFENPANGVVINVWCKAWANNLYHHRHDMAASVHFELLVD